MKINWAAAADAHRAAQLEVETQRTRFAFADQARLVDNSAWRRQGGVTDHQPRID